MGVSYLGNSPDDGRENLEGGVLETAGKELQLLGRVYPLTTQEALNLARYVTQSSPLVPANLSGKTTGRGRAGAAAARGAAPAAGAAAAAGAGCAILGTRATKKERLEPQTSILPLPPI